MDLSPDATVYYERGFVSINATLVFSWLVIALLVGGGWLLTRRLETWPPFPAGQSLLELGMRTLRNQIREISQQDPDRYTPFIGTLFIFISVSNLLGVVPGFESPTGSLSTAAALAVAVFVAVPYFGIRMDGPAGYLRKYIQPNPLMLPFNIIGEFSRTLALAVRLFGNVMSGTLTVAILLSIVPFLVPIPIQILELLIGQIQAYIFAVLAMVYIASATEAHQKGRA